MDNDEFYYSDLNEMEAYDTQHRLGTNGKSMPLTMAERNTYQNFVEGKGMVIRYMGGGRNSATFPLKNKQAEDFMDSIYKKNFYHVGRCLDWTKDRIDKAFAVREELKNDKSKRIFDLSLQKNKNIKDWKLINDSITGTFHAKKIMDKENRTIYSHGLRVNWFGEWEYEIDYRDGKAKLYKPNLIGIKPG